MTARVLAALLLLALLAACPAGEVPPAPDRAGSDCAGCHAREAEEFATTLMARAATTPTFLDEWREAGRSEDCLACHAPSGGRGLTCRDCHPGSGHNFIPAAMPETCSACHDAPGEITVRSYLRSHARARGDTCGECHLPEPGSHRFRGPSDRAFLAEAAEVRLFLRREAEEEVLAAVLRHHAGHAMPGGTTGRAVFLELTGLDTDAKVAWQERMRFGWERTADGGWKDRTLPPDRPAIIEIRHPGRGGARRIEAMLVYRPVAGPYEAGDPRQVVLDRAELALPR